MDINPQFPYYLLLYVLTVILRLIRAYRTKPENPTKEEKAQYRLRYLLFGFELVNVSAGVFILLSEKAPTYVGTIMMLYVILVIVSFFFDEESVGLKLRVGGHIAVSTIVLIVTVGAFTYMTGLNEAPKQLDKKEPVRLPVATQAVSSKWRVAFPYIDQTLNRNFGVKEEPVKSVFIIVVNAADRQGALTEARGAFLSEKGPMPFVKKIDKTPYTMMPLDGEVTAERL